MSPHPTLRCNPRAWMSPREASSSERALSQALGLLGRGLISNGAPTVGVHGAPEIQQFCCCLEYRLGLPHQDYCGPAEAHGDRRKFSAAVSPLAQAGIVPLYPLASVNHIMRSMRQAGKPKCGGGRNICRITEQGKEATRDYMIHLLASCRGHDTSHFTPRGHRNSERLELVQESWS